MRSPHALNTNDAFVMYNEIYESTVVHDATSRLRAILDAKYEPADMDAITNDSIWLNAAERESLNDLLKRFKHLFDGTLGTWNSPPYTVELKEGALPYHATPFPIPKIHKHTLKLELERLCNIGAISSINKGVL